MISYARQNSDGRPELAAPLADDHIAPAPRVSVQAFCETVETAAAVQTAGEDRRLDKAHLKIQMGGMAAAVEAYRSAPTPNVIVVEADSRNNILAGLDQLASVCEAGTRVVVIGRINDVGLYRELVRRGVSDYVLAPVNTLDVVRSICGLFSAPEAKSVGRVIAIVGAKGGVGASTIAHNVAWAIARDLALDSVVADLDLAFGTAGLDYNQDPPQGIADAVFSPDRVDTAFIDRLLSKCTDHLSPLAAIPFDPQMFGSAANNGQMIAEISANHRTTEMFLQIAQRLTGRGETKKPRGSFLSPLIEKLRAK